MNFEYVISGLTMGIDDLYYNPKVAAPYIHHMNKNLDKLMDVTNSAVAFANATSINSTDVMNAHATLLDMSVCFLHKYCRNVPK